MMKLALITQTVIRGFMTNIKTPEEIQKENEGKTFSEPQNLDECEKSFQDLITKHKITYAYHNKGKPGVYSSYPLFQGYVNIGWHKILDKLFKNMIDVGWDRKVAQIKEKFGGLRCYIGEGNDEIYELIQQAEDEASKTCEDCGSKKNVKCASPKGGYWLRTLC